MKKGLTISMIFEAQSANYGEGVGNITTLKRLTRAGGHSYSYISRQALRYNIVQQLGWDTTPLEAGSGDKKVIQFHPEATIESNPEIDLFGYMKTIQGKGAETRSAVARLSNAVSMENFSSDIDFLTNMGLSKRLGGDNSIAQSEIHRSFYTYTVTVDLDRVGIDTDIEIDDSEKASRVKSLLSTIEFLYRDIKGRRENLSPVFMVGGMYSRKTPFFEGRLRLDAKMRLNVDMIATTINSIDEHCMVGYIGGCFANDNEIEEKLNPVTTKEVFEKLRREVEAVYL